LKKSFFDFSENLASSINDLTDSLMLKIKSLNIDDIGKNITEGATNLIPSANAAEGIQPRR
jgi:hypothetical protein